MSPANKRWKDRFIQRALAGGINSNDINEHFNYEYGNKGELIGSFENPEESADDLIHLKDTGLSNVY